MKKASIAVLILASCMTAFANEYLVKSNSGVVFADVTSSRIKFGVDNITVKGLRTPAGIPMLFVVADKINLNKNESKSVVLTDLQNVVTNFALTEVDYEAWKQSQKSEEQKIAETMLIEALIEDGTLPAGSTKTTKGAAKSASKKNLKASRGNNPVHKAARELSMRISQLEAIIRSEGGDPDDAIIHVIAP